MEPAIETPIEAPPAESAEPQEPTRGYTDASRALQGELRSQIVEAEAAAAAKAEKAKAKEHRQKVGKFTVPDLRAPKDAEPEKAVIKPPPGQRFGLSEERKLELAAELKQRNDAQQPAATAVAPAKEKEPVAVKLRARSEFADDAEFTAHWYDEDYDGYEAHVNHILDSNFDYAMRRYGVDIGPRASDPEFSHLPEDLRQVAADMRPDILEQMLRAHPSEQEYHLRREQQIQQAEREEAEAYDAKYKEVQQQAADYTSQLMSSIESEPLAELRKMATDARLFGDGRDGDVAELLSAALHSDIANSDWAPHLQTLMQIAQRVPWFLMNERADLAAQAEQYLRTQMTEFFGFVKSNLEDRIALINELKQDREDAQLWREYQRKLESGEAPQLQLGDFIPGDQISGTRFHYRKH